MSQLADNICEPCRSGAPQATADEMAELMQQVQDWNIETRNNVMQLERCYTFRNFRLALAFTNKVGEIAEAAGHHPGLLTEWGKVTVTWWTHAIGGLHKNDFIMAAKTDTLL